LAPARNEMELESPSVRDRRARSVPRSNVESSELPPLEASANELVKPTGTAA
jgi:hypothetical protein